VRINSFVDKDQLEIGGSVILHHKHHCITGVPAEDIDPLVSVMKLEKAPTVSRNSFMTHREHTALGDLRRYRRPGEAN